MSKTQLRHIFRQRRHAFVASLDSAGRIALEQDLARQVAPILHDFHMAASYAAVGDEIDPVHVEERLGPHAFPRIAGKDITFHVCAWSQMIPGFQGIPEPPATAPRVDPDLLLVPLTAVTLAGVRLGQGRAYYDRALKALRGRHKVTAIGIGWDVQIAEALPADPWDEMLDWVATPTRLVECAAYR